MLSIATSPKLIIKLIILVALPIFLTFRFFFGTIFGLLITSIGLYLISERFGSSPPFNLSQLALWFDSLPMEAVGSIATSLITVVGFLIALRTASINWKDQERSRLKATAANEIEETYNEIQNLAIAMEIYANQIKTAHAKATESGDTPELQFKLRRLTAKGETFLLERDRFLLLARTSNRLVSKHSFVLAPLPGAQSVLNSIDLKVQDISEKVWFDFPRPWVFELQDPVKRFLATTEVSGLQDYIDAVEKNYDQISGLSGGLRGQLMADVVAFNIHNYSYLVKNWREIERAVWPKREKP